MISLAQLKAHLQITSVTHDTLLTDYIAWAQNAIENYCEQPIAVQFVTQPVKSYEVLDVRVITVAAVQGRNNITEAWTTLALQDYTFVTAGQYQYIEIRESYTYYQASFLVGLSPMPASVVRVCYEMCKEMAANDGILGGESTFRVSQITKSKGGDATTTVLTNLSPAHKALLNPYRYVRIA